MGIIVEFNPDLALRNISEFKKSNRKIEECIPEKLETDKQYNFLKKGQRNYQLYDDIPLLKTKGNAVLSRPIASVVILEATHFLLNGEPWTKGKYLVTEVFKDDKIHFESYKKIK